MILLTRLGLGYGVVPASAVLLLILGIRGHLRDALFFGLATLGAAGLNEVVKPVFHRARPHLWASPLPEFDYGFPSGHSMASMALVAALLVLTRGRPLRWVVALLGGGFVLAVGVSRLYLGVHYPSDVLAAWSMSLGWVSALASVFYGRGSQLGGVDVSASNGASPAAPPRGIGTG
jgi:undecaprenyl-diphosphatase